MNILRFGLLTAASLSLISAFTAIQPAQAQYGLMGPDGSIRQYGLLIDGPNPGRVLQDRLTLPINRRSIDPGSGSIYRGNLLESGPSPMRRIQLCMQIGIC
ncbi:hypothetical protein [Synechococcus sp. UW140]|uniref:hypothetical protein n=1 Tax=Synechococcus sp. UW140 TaxID=368503 RepID=UPI003137B9CA